MMMTVMMMTGDDDDDDCYNDDDVCDGVDENYNGSGGKIMRLM